MKAMGYANSVVTSIYLAEGTSTLYYMLTSGNKAVDKSVDLSSISVASATKATNDVNNDRIDETYARKDKLLNTIYPVGSIYMSVSDNSPQNFLGGTWVRIEGQFLLGAGSGYNAGSTGGEATHTLTTDEMPSHNHFLNRIVPGGSGGNYTVMATTTQSANSWDSSKKNSIPNVTMDSRGESKAHNNMPPYLAVYIWKRTA